jgi:hypothetical protein
MFGDFSSDQENPPFLWQDSHMNGNQGSPGSTFLTQTSIFLTIFLVSGAIRLYVTLGLTFATLHFFSYFIYIPWLILVIIFDYFPYQILKILLCNGEVVCLLLGKIFQYICIYVIRDILKNLWERKQYYI